MHPKEYKPMYGPGDHPEYLVEADRVDAQIRKYLAEQGSKPPEKKPTPKYVPKCPTCGSPDIEKFPVHPKQCRSLCSVSSLVKCVISSSVRIVGMSGKRKALLLDGE